jgi:hypothetical protein
LLWLGTARRLRSVRWGVCVVWVCVWGCSAVWIHQADPPLGGWAWEYLAFILGEEEAYVPHWARKTADHQISKCAKRPVPNLTPLKYNYQKSSVLDCIPFE